MLSTPWTMKPTQDPRPVSSFQSDTGRFTGPQWFHHAHRCAPPTTHRPGRVVPEVVAEVATGVDQHVGFTVRKKRFAWYLDNHHGDGIVALTCKAPLGVNTQLAAQEPDRFFIPSYTGKRGWLGVRIDREILQWEAIADLVEDAYRLTAPKSLLARLDDPRG